MATNVSIIIPVQNEEENIHALYDQIKKVMEPLPLTYEIIFIDDGSVDRTYATLASLKLKDPCLNLYRLDQNHGQSFALIEGFKRAKGEIIITMDGDLQHDPADIPAFLDAVNKGSDLVSGWRYDRNDSLLRKLISWIFNYIVRLKTGIPLHDYGCAFVAGKRTLIEHLNQNEQKERFIKPFLVTKAVKITEIKIRHYPRKAAVSKYSYPQIVRYGLDFIFHFHQIEDKSNDP